MTVVLDELVVGQRPAGDRIDRDHRIGVETLTRTIEGVEVRRGISRRHVENVVRRIERKGSPECTP